ncbi:Neurogenic locus notch-like protein 2 [Holothuria leucospilota]|uniref:Neurogenic locus notch-like protein 2 n=1 Tax=Holothuria leucospilota TaxID=206669 RepID=A0A9Q1CIR9_HOLLE|nr:Neurogenic locus notch-like protein 2 [Holothuria leucospilota]
MCTFNPTACSGFGEICVDDADGNGFHCECQEYWLRNADNTTCYAPCTMNSCFNSGRCFLQGENFFCVCPEGFTGFVCEKPIVEPVAPCDSCKNGGICVKFSNGFYCECVDGFTGIDCSVPPQIDTTTLEPEQLCPAGACQNGGTCQPFDEGGFHCICPEGYTGLNCSILITTTTTTTPTTRMVISNKDICTVLDPCENNAICLPNTNHEGELYPMCLCQPGYAGATCSVKLPTPSVCLGHPCGPDALCYSNATAISGYSCLCLQTEGICAGNYFAGNTPTPAGSLSPCESNPCQNGGTCEENGASFSCICPPYIVGDMCETDIRDCVYKDSWYTEGDVRSDGCIKCNCSNGDWQCTDDDCHCEHEDKLYENGQTWTDQCMTCFCYNGGWLCSDSDCSNTCQHEGLRYFSGDVREESCETCFCRNGDWTCTEKDCDFCVDGDAVYLEGAVRSADCNLCTCSKKEWMCTIKDCDFPGQMNYLS